MPEGKPSPEIAPGSSQEVVVDERGLVEWGAVIGREARVPLVLCLWGDLGVGKSTLARAIARGAGVVGSIPSPTYNLLFRYPGRDGIEVVHLDLYRIEDIEEIWGLGWAELPGDRELVMIEWPERARPLLPANRWDITLTEREPTLRGVAVERRGYPLPLPQPLPGRG